MGSTGYSFSQIEIANKIYNWLWRIRVYAGTTFFIGCLVLLATISSTLHGIEFLFHLLISGALILGSVGLVFRPIKSTIITHGTSCLLASLLSFFVIIYWQGKTDPVITIIGLLISIAGIRFAVLELFGKNRKLFDSGILNDEIHAYINKVKLTLKKARKDDENIIFWEIFKNKDFNKGKIGCDGNFVYFLSSGDVNPLFFRIHDLNLSVVEQESAPYLVEFFYQTTKLMRGLMDPVMVSRFSQWKDRSTVNIH